MGKIKIYDIAKELDITSKEVLEIAKKLDINVKSHLSSVEEVEAQKIKENIKKTSTTNNKEKSKKVKEKKSNTEKDNEKNETPVIIRREVIITDDNSNKKEVAKKEEKKSNNIGFVERKNSKDYNIVYRNRPTKPMTVDELFGIKKDNKEENKKVEEKVEPKTENKLVDKMISYAENVLHDNGYKPYYLYRQKNQLDGQENVGYYKEHICLFNVDTMEECLSVLACGAGGISKRVYSLDNRIERESNAKDIKQYIERIDEMIDKKTKLFS